MLDGLAVSSPLDVFEPIVEPVVLRGEADENASGLVVTGDYNVLPFGLSKKPRQIILNFRKGKDGATLTNLHGVGYSRNVVPGIEVEGFRIVVNTRDERGHIRMARRNVKRARELVGDNFGTLVRLWEKFNG